ncbi:Carboxypeptidase B [Gryllus bimaculatus]|nr:Carboxypeptidase B [Gryllus bimaculatus]
MALAKTSRGLGRRDTEAARVLSAAVAKEDTDSESSHCTHTVKALAQEANLAQKRAGGHDFTVGQTARVFYAAAGGSDDWVAAAGRVPLVYTVEMPRGGNWGFDLPPSAIQRTVSAFWPAVRVMGRHVQRSASERAA